MKNIICYGDSNTFGYNPINSSRYDENTRWTDVLQKNLGAEYEVINEGMPNRTGFVDNPDGFLFSSQKHFPKTLLKFDDLYILILAIGTNDLMFKYNVNFDTIEKGLNNLIKIANEKTNNVIIVPPTVLSENILIGNFSSMFDKTSITKSKKVSKIYQRIADLNHCKYFDINEFAIPSDIDGLHYDKISHRLIADKLTLFINENFI